MIDIALSLLMCHQICNMCVCLGFFVGFFFLGGEGGGLWPALCPIPSGLWLNMCPLSTNRNVMYHLNPIDPRNLPANMQYFPRNSPNSLKISPKFRANNNIQSLTNADPFYQNENFFFLHFRGHFIGFYLIYCTPICGFSLLDGSICGKIWKNG